MDCRRFVTVCARALIITESVQRMNILFRLDLELFSSKLASQVYKSIMLIEED